MAIAVDPNVPRVEEVVRGVVTAIKGTSATDVILVVRDEATVEMADSIRQAAAPFTVVCHESSDREAQSYLAADRDANPIYLNRHLVDADWVLPIVAARGNSEGLRRDTSGIFPNFCDSATRLRCVKERNVIATDESFEPLKQPLTPSGRTIDEEIPWLLGIQMILMASVNGAGELAAVRAGTVESLASLSDPFQGRVGQAARAVAPLVIAACDGDDRQQTWENVVRAATVASMHSPEDGTIVIWSGVNEEPDGRLLQLDRIESDFPEDAAVPSEDAFPAWDRFEAMADRLGEVMESHRLLLHSRLPRETVERLGLGVIESEQELANLQKGFDDQILIRAASFFGDY